MIDNDWNVEFDLSGYDVLLYFGDKIYFKDHVSLEEVKDLLLSDFEGKIRIKDNASGKISEYL